MFDRYNIIDEADLASAVAKRFNGKVTATSEGFAEQASQLTSAAPILRSVAQLVEHRSPNSAPLRGAAVFCADFGTEPHHVHPSAQMKRHSLRHSVPSPLRCSAARSGQVAQ